MQSRTIAHVISANDVFGPEKTTLNECIWLQKQGWRCLVINIWSEIDVPIRNKAIQAGVEYHSLVSSKRFDRGLISRLKALLTENQCLLVHSHGYKSDLFTYLATRNTSIHRVTTIHGWTSEDMKVRFYEWLQARIWRLYDRVYAVSRGYWDIAIKKRIPDSKMRLIYNGIIVNPNDAWQQPDKAEAKRALGLNPEAPVISIIGRLSIEKGHDMFVAVAAEVVKHRNPVQFVIVGDGVQMAPLQQLVSEKGLTDTVIFLGHCDKMNVLYDATDIVAICSHREGLPNVLLEAMLHAIPVVSVKVGGVPEVIEDGKSGLITSGRDTGDFAAKILKLLDDRSCYESTSQAARERIIAQFTFEKRMRTIFEEYTNLMDKN